MKPLLPRLLYICDVPVESSYHGSALIYRLLQDYPTEKLAICEGNLWKSLPERRLPGVCYFSIDNGWKRLLHTRFSCWVRLIYSFVASWRTGAVKRASSDFQPEAVLTVAHEFLWLTAASYARKHSLPLHLICHDDWPRLAGLPVPFRNWLDREFAKIYCQAASRLCVSPYMAEEYERRYGAKGTVLYPSRAMDGVCFNSPPLRLSNDNTCLTIAYAGNLSSPEYVVALKLLGQCLEKIEGTLLIYGPLSEKSAVRIGLNRSNIKICGMLTSSDLIKCLRDESNTLFVPMSFLPTEREQSALSFPSKLTDYTGVGLPLLIYGPEYCSAARWASENLGVAELVTIQSEAALDAALIRLSQPEYRLALAMTAIREGSKYFSHTVAEKIFNEVLMSNTSSS